ncbi:MAG: SIMPL domain-containing protein [Chloroflexi bacterium]|nr:SIMPL domain-containing protein [Chloroflexota bacterium]
MKKIFGIFLFVCILFLVVGSGHSQEAVPLKTIEVVASGKVEVVPDTVIIKVLARSSSGIMADALTLNEKKVDRIKEAIENLRITKEQVDISDTKINSDERSAFYSQSEALKYSATVIFTIRMKIEKTAPKPVEKKVEKILDALVRADASLCDIQENIYPPRFIPVAFSITNARQYESKILESALQEAKIKAEALAKTMNVQLGEIQEVEILSPLKKSGDLTIYSRCFPALDEEEMFSSGTLKEIPLTIYLTVKYSFK